MPLTGKGISMAKRLTGKRKAQLAGIAVSFVCSDLFRKFQNDHGFAMPDLMTTAYVIGESMNGNRNAWRRTAPKNEIAAFFWEALAFRSNGRQTGFVSESFPHNSSRTPPMSELQRQLKERFGFDGFRDGQEAAISRLLEGRSVLAMEEAWGGGR